MDCLYILIAFFGLVLVKFFSNGIENETIMRENLFKKTSDHVHDKKLRGVVFRKGKINGANVTSHKYHPYQVRIIGKYGDTKIYCGGSILDDYHVISAAHCFIDFSEYPYPWDKGFSYLVVAGATDFENDDRSAWTTANVRKIYVPKVYYESLRKKDPSKIGDIAVLELDESINLMNNSHLQAVQLPESPDDSYINKTAIVTGYGAYRVEKDNNGKWNRTSDGKLRFATAKVLENSECQKKWDEYTKSFSWRDNITEKHICAQIDLKRYKKPVGVCNGDSGGPLVYLQGEQNILLGVVGSSIVNCDEKKAPTTYARVSFFKNFIEKVQNHTDYDLDHPEILTTNPPIKCRSFFKV